MKSNYPTRLLGDLIRLEYGKPLPAADRTSEEKIPAYGANGILCWSRKALRQESSIIVGRKGSAGEVNLTDGPFWPTDVTYFVDHDKSETNLRYLFYLFKFLELPKLAKGVKPGINRNDVYALRVPAPPLAEQKRIVAILDEAFEGIAKATANAERNEVNARRLFDSLLNRTFLNQENWIQFELGARVRFVDYRGKTPPKTEIGIRLITAKNVKMGFIQRIPEEFVDPDAYDGWMTRGFPQPGDILFTTEAPLGNVAQLDTDEKIIVGQRLITMQPDREFVMPDFLKWLLMSSSAQSAIWRLATGATVQGIKAKLLKKIILGAPDLGTQATAAKRLNEAWQLHRKLQAEYREKSSQLFELRASILRKAFSGQLINTKASAA